MTALVQSLIDKQDSFEVVRDQITQRLKDELVNQQNLAVADGRDPSDWELKVYAERFNPVEEWLNTTNVSVDKTPVINVWFDNIAFDGNASSISERQKGTGTYNIDCYALGIATDQTTGHLPGDEDASKQVQRVAKLVRNILMASSNVYIGFPPGFIWRRWITSITSFQPQINSNTVQQVVGVRIILQVDFSEESPQYVGESLCNLGVTLQSAEDGSIIAQVEYDYAT